MARHTSSIRRQVSDRDIERENRRKRRDNVNRKGR